MTFYTDHFIPQPHAGYTRGFVILIRPAYRNDRGLLEHEKVHVRQFWRFWERKSRLEREVEAYREQLKWSPGREYLFATYIATRYGLDISIDAAEKLLRS